MKKYLVAALVACLGILSVNAQVDKTIEVSQCEANNKLTVEGQTLISTGYGNLVFPENDYTDEGNLIGHIVIGYGMLVERIAKIDGFPHILAQELEHCILSHHGELEYGSPKRPSLVESWILAAADKLDANLEVIRCDLNSKNSNAWLDYNNPTDPKYRTPLLCKGSL